MPAVSLTVASPTPTVTGPVVVPSPPFASRCPLIRRLKRPGSDAGTTTFCTSTVPVQRGEPEFAVTEWPDSVQVSALSAPNAVWKTPAYDPA